MTGPSPVDRGKPGSKLHTLTDRTGIPLAVAISAANTNDDHALRPLVRAVPAVRSAPAQALEAARGQGLRHHRAALLGR